MALCRSGAIATTIMSASDLLRPFAIPSAIGASKHGIALTGHMMSESR